MELLEKLEHAFVFRDSPGYGDPRDPASLPRFVARWWWDVGGWVRGVVAAGADPSTRVHDAAQVIGIPLHLYAPPTGEPLDRWSFHLNEAHPPQPTPNPDADDLGDDEPPPTVTGQWPPPAPPHPNSPQAKHPAEASSARTRNSSASDAPPYAR